MKYVVFTVLMLFLFAGCDSTPEPKRGPLEKTFFYIRQAHMDVGVLKGGVKSIDYYNPRKPERTTVSFTVDGQELYLHETITYASDGRRLQEKNHGFNTDMLYYYDSEKKLYLRRYVRNEYQSEDSHRFWYDEYGNPVKVLEYRLSPGKKPYYDGYEEMVYTYNEEEENRVYTALETFSIGAYDTLRRERDRYDVARFDRYARPIYMNGMNCYYDDKGRLAYQEDEEYQVTKSYQYEGNRLSKMIEKRTYGESVSRKTFTYNTYGDLVSEIDSWGYEYEYEYDEKGNWLQKKKFYVSDNERNLSEFEVRKITYFADGETEEGIDESLLDVDEDILYMADHVVQWADEKQRRLDAYEEAVYSGDYGRRVTLQSAADIKDFTPLLWETIGEAYGDLDGDGVPDRVVVYKTPVARVGWDTSCCLVIYRRVEEHWELWDQSFAPVLSPEVGGMMTNTFDEVVINDECISVIHQGLRWNCYHSYKYIDDAWRLIYAQSYGGNACSGGGYEFDAWAGVYISKWNVYDCEDEGKEEISERNEYRIILDELPLMDEGVPDERRMTVLTEDGEEKEIQF